MFRHPTAFSKIGFFLRRHREHALSSSSLRKQGSIKLKLESR